MGKARVNPYTGEAVTASGERMIVLDAGQDIAPAVQGEDGPTIRTLQERADLALELGELPELTGGRDE